MTAERLSEAIQTAKELGWTGDVHIFTSRDGSMLDLKPAAVIIIPASST